MRKKTLTTSTVLEIQGHDTWAVFTDYTHNFVGFHQCYFELVAAVKKAFEYVIVVILTWINILLVLCASLYFSLSCGFIKVPMLDTAAGGPISRQCCVINKEHIREREREREISFSLLASLVNSHWGHDLLVIPITLMLPG